LRQDSYNWFAKLRENYSSRCGAFGNTWNETAFRASLIWADGQDGADWVDGQDGAAGADWADGADGADWEDGATFDYRGDYNISASYDTGHVVLYQGAGYVSRIDINTSLPTDVNNWGKISEKGIDGEGSGDMTKLVYDTDNSGVVDNSELLAGQAGSYYLDRANHTGSLAITDITNWTK